jgi:hypothetical protein
MVAKGHPNKVIADVLNISSWTVCTHLRRIFAKLGVGSALRQVLRHTGFTNVDSSNDMLCSLPGWNLPWLGEMFASGTQEESMKSLAAATPARGAVGFEWSKEAGHGAIGMTLR